MLSQNGINIVIVLSSIPQQEVLSLKNQLSYETFF